MIPLALLGWLATSASSAVGQIGDRPAAEAAIRAARAHQNRAIAAGSLDEAMEFWTRDVTVRAGLGFSIEGPSAYRDAFANDSGTVYHRRTERVLLSERWPLALEEGSWSGRNQETGEVMISGRYSAQWLHVQGRWKIRSEIFVALECSGNACLWPVSR